MTDKLSALKALYTEIQACEKCSGVQCGKVMRVLEKVNINSKVMIISEAMAPSQVRLSWVNFFDVNGNIWNTGKMLERFLRQLWLSVYPEDPNCVYNTEIVHCFPGYISSTWSSSIRRPSLEEVYNCIWKWFIQQEIDLIWPKIIFLMWKTSYETFYERFLWLDKVPGLTKKIEQITLFWKFDIFHGATVVPIQHASWANPRYNAMLQNKEYIRLIQWISQ